MTREVFPIPMETFLSILVCFGFASLSYFFFKAARAWSTLIASLSWESTLRLCHCRWLHHSQQS